MNWKEHAHLFANGKFNCYCSEEGGEVWNITGFELGLSDNVIYLSIKDKYGYHVETPLSTITLIARKIEDMTDEEMQKCIDLEKNPFGWDIDRYREEMSFGFDDLGYEEFLYLLSIGVYPFDQTHFETGEVIDRSAL